MKKHFVAFLLILSFFACILSIAITTRSVRAGFAADEKTEELARLKNLRDELEAEYFRIVLENLEPRAREAGFVSIETPQYIERDVVVGFVSSK